MKNFSSPSPHQPPNFQMCSVMPTYRPLAFHHQQRPIRPPVAAFTQEAFGIQTGKVVGMPRGVESEQPGRCGWFELDRLQLNFQLPRSFPVVGEGYLCPVGIGHIPVRVEGALDAAHRERFERVDPRRCCEEVAERRPDAGRGLAIPEHGNRQLAEDVFLGELVLRKFKRLHLQRPYGSCSSQRQCSRFARARWSGRSSR